MEEFCLGYGTIALVLERSLMMETIGTTEATFRLGISPQRVRQLLKDNRIKGAKKVNGFWVIPVKNGMPQVTERRKGPRGTWNRRLRQANTRIHINRHVLAGNKRNNRNDPPILIRQGNRTKACHQVDIPASCRLVYEPNHPLPCGAVLWIEVDKTTAIYSKCFRDMLS